MVLKARTAGWRGGMRFIQLVQLLLLWTTCALASIEPLTEGSAVDPQSGLAAVNEAITAQAAAAVAAGKATLMLVTLRTSQQQIEAQAQTISAASVTELPAHQATIAAQVQVYAAVKASVLGAALISPSSSLVTPEVTDQPQGNLHIVRDYSHLPIVAVSISSPAVLERLRAHPDVLAVEPNWIARTANTQAFGLVGQPMVTASGYWGNGNTAVTIDTGLDYKRALFGPCTAPGVPAETCRVLYTEDLEADDGLLDEADTEATSPHGTNVAGIIASLAPGVKFVGFDVFDRAGDAYFGTIVEGINWAVANKAKYNITVINMSLGAPLAAGKDCDDSAASEACNTAADAGIICVAASGNSGNKAGILMPACASKVVAVGAVYGQDVTSAGWTTDPGSTPKTTCTDRNAKPDTIPCFSNSNSKVALLAPGYQIEAAGTVMSGTSQATPFVAAAIAIVRSRYPSYTNQQVVDLLTRTGSKVKDPVNSLDIPRLSIRAAMGISCAPQLTPNSIRAAAAEGSYTLTVTAPSSDCTWQVTTPTVTWMRPVGATTGTGTGTVVVQVDAAAAAARSEGLVITCKDASSSMLVSQPAATMMMADSRAPVMKQLTATTANGVVDLAWPVAQDLQSGVSSYRVVYAAGSRAPSLHCTTGTLAPGQPQVSGGNVKLTVTGLTVGMRYTFRVCPLDAAGNMAGGRMYRVTVKR